MASFNFTCLKKIFWFNFQEEEEEEALPELSDDEKSQVLELINSGELNPNDIDENDLPDPDRTRVTPGLGNFLIFISSKL